MVYIIPNFLVLHFGENFMKIWLKIPKLQMYENCIKKWMKTCFHSYFMQFFMSFYGGQLKQLYTANFLYVFLINLKWLSSSSFPNLKVQMLFLPQIQQAPGPDFRMVGKSLPSNYMYRKNVCTQSLIVYSTNEKLNGTGVINP